MLLANCGGSDGAGPGAALKKQIGWLTSGQYGRAWDQMHPAQQALMSREQYARCAGARSIPDFEVTLKEIYDEEVQIPGTEEKVMSKAVTVELRYGGSRDTDTFHEFLVDGQWRWTASWTDADVEAIRDGDCPS
jgi:hypothetical protein